MPFPRSQLSCAALLATAMINSYAAEAPRADALAAEESRFAAHSVAHGMRDAFVEFFAGDSVLLRPDPVNGREYMKAQKNPPIVLDWKSRLVVVSGSGELGLSTGPWKSTSKANPTEPASFGQFFSIWQKQKDGAWKVLMDHGISHGNSEAPAQQLRSIDLPDTGKGSRRGVTDDPERQFIAAATRDTADAYRQFSGNHTRLLREQRAPIDGAAAIATYLKSQTGQWTWRPGRQAASTAGDFSYTLGTWTHRSPAGLQSQGHYIRVWIADSAAPSAKWTLAAEILTPRAPGK